MATQLPAGAVWADTGEAVRPDAAPEGQSTAQIDVTALAAAAARRARSALAVSLATRALLALLVLGYVGHVVFGQRGDLFFALVCRKTVPRVWNVLTCSFWEQSLPALCVSVACLATLSRVLEPLWGTAEFMRFVLATAASVGCATFASLFVLYIVTQDIFYLNATVSGFHGVVAALLVAARQLMPNEAPFPLMPWLRVRWLAQLYLLGSVIVAVASGAKHHHIGLSLMVLYGVFSGWVYLRFLHRLPSVSAAAAGDQSEEMSWESLFPQPLQPLCANIGNLFFRLCCVRPAAAGGASSRYVAMLGAEREAIVSAAETARDPNAPPQLQEADARKREAHTQRALKLLEERLRASNRSAAASLEEAEEASPSSGE